MKYASKIIDLISSHRLRALDRVRQDGVALQGEQFALLQKGAGDYLRPFNTASLADFQRTVPIVSYQDLEPAIERVRGGELNYLWRNSSTRWLAKSSGTTSSVSKYIPITARYLANCHYRGGRDVMAVFNDNFPQSKAFTGKALTLGGSARIDASGAAGLAAGDLSAILIANTPSWVSLLREPKAAVALIPDFAAKCQAICRTTVGRHITSFAGVPSWNMVLMNKVLEFTGKDNLLEVWPDMSLFIHGGIAFTPYRAEYEKLIPSPEMKYMETYNASEGFFALQDDPNDSSMLLMLDYEIFYEFLPVAALDDHRQAIPLEGVRLGVNYAMIISNSGGLWRYMIGDTVEFTSLNPYKIKITGRTKHFINAFGEEVIIDNAERALQVACRATGAAIADYTAAPIFMQGRQKGAHEWLIEFSTMPTDTEQFIVALDEALQAVNSDYAAKRYKSTTLVAPHLRVAPHGLFHRWLESKGKLGGQNKVPRLMSDRQVIDELLALLVE
ncbi:MAG: GH3 auxin-responsive promoter family protein [Mucinivorans sp.]